VTRSAVAAVRERVPFLDRDRYMDEDITAVVEMIQAGSLTEVLPARD
jgi:histidine ammonia-lyase